MSGDTTKTFSLGALLSVTTGVLLVRSFGDVHEVFDHLYPGIMTIGVSMMFGKAKARVLAQHPSLADVVIPDLGEQRGERVFTIIDPWLEAMVEKYGAELTIDTDPNLQTPEQNGVA